jgi:hypothetical protein
VEDVDQPVQVGVRRPTSWSRKQARFIATSARTVGSGSIPRIRPARISARTRSVMVVSVCAAKSAQARAADSSCAADSCSARRSSP